VSGNGSRADTERRGAMFTNVPPLSASFHTKGRAIVARYPEGQERSALMSLLYLAQAEHGFVTGQAMGEIGALVGITKAEVQAVATFYTMFKREPQGRWLVSVCSQPSCALAGGGEIVHRACELAGIEPGGTSANGSITVEEVECLCACDGAPVFSVNYENYERMSVDDALGLIQGLHDGGTPPPGTRGEVPLEFTAVSERMAGPETVA
jgi:NADH-quinone oxidoreductase subunit E